MYHPKFLKWKFYVTRITIFGKLHDDRCKNSKNQKSKIKKIFPYKEIFFDFLIFDFWFLIFEFSNDFWTIFVQLTEYGISYHSKFLKMEIICYTKLHEIPYSVSYTKIVVKKKFKNQKSKIQNQKFKIKKSKIFFCTFGPNGTP